MELAPGLGKESDAELDDQWAPGSGKEWAPGSGKEWAPGSGKESGVDLGVLWGKEWVLG